MARKKNLQPFLDYFKMLQTYEQQGYLETSPEKHEAYITMPAFMTLLQITSSDIVQLQRIPLDALYNIRAYAAWKSQTGTDYLSWNFALHIVGADAPHDIVITLLMTRKRKWYRLWRKTDCVETISYT